MVMVMDMATTTRKKMAMEQLRVYTAESSIRKPRVLIGGMFKDLMNSRELAWRLALRDINALYRQSFLGILWAFIVPLASTVTWLFLRSSGIVSVNKTDIPYPIYVFSGTMIWAILLEGMQAPLLKSIAGKPMLTKINFPHEAIILSGVYQTLFNAGIKVVLMFIAAFAFGYFSFNWTLVLFPVAILSLVLSGTVVGLVLTPIGLLYTDIGKGLPIVMQFLMYATPVVYPMPSGGLVEKIISYNPITPMIMTTRDFFSGSELHFLDGFLWVNAGILIILFLSWIAFRAAMPILVERMSS